jgi:hypothetical protein
MIGFVMGYFGGMGTLVIRLRLAGKRVLVNWQAMCSSLAMRALQNAPFY